MSKAWWTPNSAKSLFKKKKFNETNELVILWCFVKWKLKKSLLKKFISKSNEVNQNLNNYYFLNILMCNSKMLQVSKDNKDYKYN